MDGGTLTQSIPGQGIPEECTRNFWINQAASFRLQQGLPHPQQQQQQGKLAASVEQAARQAALVQQAREARPMGAGPRGGMHNGRWMTGVP